MINEDKTKFIIILMIRNFMIQIASIVSPTLNFTTTFLSGFLILEVQDIQGNETFKKCFKSSKHYYLCRNLMH